MRTVDPAKHEERKAQILAAAERCFARRGFHGATIAQICTEASISPGHLYHYFPSKEAMIAASAESGLTYVQARLAELTELRTDAITAIVAELATLRGKPAAREPGVLLDILAEAARDPVAAEALNGASKAMRLLLAEFIGTAQERGEIDATLDPEMAATIIISQIDAAKGLLARFPDLDMDRFAGAVDIMMRRFLRV